MTIFSSSVDNESFDNGKFFNQVMSIYLNSMLQLSLIFKSTSPGYFFTDQILSLVNRFYSTLLNWLDIMLHFLIYKLLRNVIFFLPQLTVDN